MAKANKAKKKEEASATNVVPFSPANVAALKLPEGVKVVRRVTLPSLAIKKTGEQRILFIMDAIRISKIKQKVELDDSGKAKAPREPAHVCSVGDVETGEAYIFIVAAVVRENLLRDYPNDSYVGKSFVIRNMGKRTETQRYNDFSIIEVDVPTNANFVTKSE